MKARNAAICALAIALGFSGCQTFTPVPEFHGVALNPAQLHPGDVAVVTVELKDSNNIVDRVEGVLEETPTVTFKLRDDGQSPDEKANDDLWTLKVDVPFDAPAGSFILKFTAYRSDGEIVTVRDKSGATVPLSTTHPFAVEYAQEQK